MGEKLNVEEQTSIKHIYRISISQRLDQRLNQEVIETCMTKATIVSRVLGWFWRQNSILQNIIVGTISREEAPHMAAESLSRHRE